MILRDRNANPPAAEAGQSADLVLEERVYYCQNWRADVVALMTSVGVLINQVRYDPYGKPFGIAPSAIQPDLDADGDVDNSDASLFATYHFNSTMPFADWNWDGTKNLSDQSAYTADKNADAGLGRGVPAYSTWSHAGAANRKLYAGYEIDPVLTGSEGWESVYHVRFRVLFSGLGRWVSRDTFPHPSSQIALYLYAFSVPVPNTDAFGLTPWSNWDFVYWYYIGGGTPITLASAGLANAYEAHPPVVSVVNSVLARWKRANDKRAQTEFESLGCNKCPPDVPYVDYTFESVGRSTVSTAAMISGMEAVLALYIALGDYRGAFDYFWFTDWTYAIGGHQLLHTTTCRIVADCGPGPLLHSGWWWGCNVNFKMRDQFADPTDLLGYLRKKWGIRIPQWALQWLPGEPYWITHRFSRQVSNSKKIPVEPCAY